MGLVSRFLGRGNKKLNTVEEIRNLRMRIEGVPSRQEIENAMEFIYKKEERRRQWESLEESRKGGALWEMIKIMREEKYYGRKKG